MSSPASTCRLTSFNTVKRSEPFGDVVHLNTHRRAPCLNVQYRVMRRLSRMSFPFDNRFRHKRDNSQ